MKHWNYESIMPKRCRVNTIMSIIDSKHFAHYGLKELINSISKIDTPLLLLTNILEPKLIQDVFQRLRNSPCFKDLKMIKVNGFDKHLTQTGEILSSPIPIFASNPFKNLFSSNHIKPMLDNAMVLVKFLKSIFFIGCIQRLSSCHVLYVNCCVDWSA